MQRRTLLVLMPAWGLASGARAHHGWSRFDQGRPIYLEGRAVEVRWRNPHAELVLEVPEGLRVPAGLAQRAVPPQRSPVDGAGLLHAASVPTRADRRWTIELAPLGRMNAWAVPEVQEGQSLAVLGFTFAGEQGDAVLRAEYLWLGDRTYGMRSAPA